LRLLLRFWRLPAADRRRVACATALVVLTRSGMTCLGYPRWRRLLFRFAYPRRRKLDCPSEEVARIVWAVTAAGQRLLGDKRCLTEALVAQFLLSRRGVAADLQIGVARGGKGQLEAHAWIEHEGRVLVGHSPDLERYNRLLPAGRMGAPVGGK
jgi:hypothetical protein